LSCDLESPALSADSSRNPPNGRMIEKHGLHNGLDERDEIIVPPYVRQFMGEYVFYLDG
jgi:hypothetical protein